MKEISPSVRDSRPVICNNRAGWSETFKSIRLASQSLDVDQQKLYEAIENGHPIMTAIGYVYADFLVKEKKTNDRY